jgi:HAMP domain-containing protein
MRILTQNLLAIVPVFIFLALGMSGLIFYLEDKEIRWGLREEAAALATTIAEMVDDNGFAHLAEMEDKEREALLAPFTKVLKWKNVSRIFAFAPHQRKCLFDLGDHATFHPPAFPGPAGPDALARVQLVEHNKWGDFMQALAPVTDSENHLLGYIGVHTNAKILQEQVERSKVNAAKRILIALGVGFLCAWLISWVLRKGLSSLDRAARLAGKGQSEHMAYAEKGTIREINDLGNSFNTMISILKDTMTRAQRKLTGVGLYNSPRFIRKAVSAHYWTAREMEAQGIAFRTRPVGDFEDGLFFDLFKVQDHAYSVFGRVKHDRPDHLERAMNASAMLHYLKDLLVSRPAAEALQMAVPLFSFSQFQMIRWEQSALQLKLYRYNTETGGFSETTENLAIGQSQLYHNLDGRADNRFSLYTKEFVGAVSEHAMDDFIQLVRGIVPSPSGVLVMVTRKAHVKAKPAVT